MKKKIFGAIAVFAIAAVAAFNVSLNMNENEMSQLSLANVEALAQESGDDAESKGCDTKIESKDSTDKMWCGRPVTRTVTSECISGVFSYCYTGSTLFIYSCGNSMATKVAESVTQKKCK